MLLHDIEVPNIYHMNSLKHNLLDYTDADKFDVILMNPPYGGHEDKSIQGFFPDDLASSETADLFMSVILYGKLSEARFQMLSDDYEQEQADLRAKIEMLENEIQNQEDQAENVDRFIRQAKKYLYLEKLTPTILNDMVNAVYVHAPDKSSGHRVQDVTISYNYIGILPANLLYDVMNGKAA